MSRLARSQSIIPNLVHHVVLRGNNRRRLFSYKRDYAEFLRRMGEAQKHGSVLLHAYCLMTNHVHLLVTPQDARSLSRFIANIAQSYARFRNHRAAGSGKLFEERYYSAPIRDERHLATAVTYIELNPVRAGVVEVASDYPWSSCAWHCGVTRVVESDWARCVPLEWYRGLGVDALARCAAYRGVLATLTQRSEDLFAAEFAVAQGRVRAQVAGEVRASLRRPNGARAAGGRR